MRLTKNDMARVIVQALYNLPRLPAADHPEVVKRATRGKVETLAPQHKLSCDVLGSVKKLTLPVSEVPPGIGWTLVTGNSFQNVWERQ